MTQKENILAAAARLFQWKGYSATGINEILAESGCPKGSLYYYFPQGKLQVALESVEYVGRIIVGHVTARLSQEGDPAKAFQLVVNDIAAHCGERIPDLEDISLTIIALESLGEEESLREACDKVFEEREALFVRKLADAGYPAKDARRLGGLVHLLIEGAIIAARTRGDPSALVLVSRSIPSLIERRT
jgi:TetR/AcrR family transcriptional repressor of lmrAB and yxaGH operons